MRVTLPLAQSLSSICHYLTVIITPLFSLTKIPSSGFDDSCSSASLSRWCVSLPREKKASGYVESADISGEMCQVLFSWWWIPCLLQVPVWSFIIISLIRPQTNSPPTETAPRGVFGLPSVTAPRPLTSEDISNVTYGKYILMLVKKDRPLLSYRKSKELSEACGFSHWENGGGEERLNR